MTWIISLIIFIGGLGGGMVFPILPALGQKLGIEGFMVGLILSSNRISRLIFNIPAGRAFNQLGVRRTISGAMLAETISLLFFSVAMHSTRPAIWLLVGRSIFGVGAAFLMVGAQAAALEQSNDSDRGKKTSAVRLAMNSAIPGGLIMGGLVADIYSDNTAFLVGAGITFIGALVSILFLPKKNNASYFAGNIPTQYQKPKHFFPKSPGIILAFSLNFLVFLTVNGALLATLVLLLQQHHLYLTGMEAQGSSGIVMTIMVSTAAISSLGVGRILDRMSNRSQILFISLILLVLGFYILASATSIITVVIASVLIGLSFNSLTLPIMVFIGEWVETSEQSHSVSLFQNFGDVGGTLGPILGIQAVSMFGVRNLYIGMAVLCLCFLPILFRLRQIERQYQDNKTIEFDEPSEPCSASQLG